MSKWLARCIFSLWRMRHDCTQHGHVIIPGHPSRCLVCRLMPELLVSYLPRLDEKRNLK